MPAVSPLAAQIPHDRRLGGGRTASGGAVVGQHAVVFFGHLAVEGTQPGPSMCATGTPSFTAAERPASVELVSPRDDDRIRFYVPADPFDFDEHLPRFASHDCPS